MTQEQLKKDLTIAKQDIKDLREIIDKLSVICSRTSFINDKQLSDILYKKLKDIKADVVYTAYLRLGDAFELVGDIVE